MIFKTTDYNREMIDALEEALHPIWGNGVMYNFCERISNGKQI